MPAGNIPYGSGSEIVERGITPPLLGFTRGE
jgi:hypothetical protein